MSLILKRPSAWVPIALSLAMLAFILILLGVYGVPTPDPNADEGTAARLFQLWLVLEIFLVAFFAIKWLPRAPGPAFLVLVVQIAAALAACAPVFLLHL